MGGNIDKAILVTGLVGVEAPTFSRESAHRWRLGQPLRAGCPIPPKRFLVLISVRGCVDPRAIVRLEGLYHIFIPKMKMKLEIICVTPVESQ
jgi:hypothetical protein